MECMCAQTRPRFIISSERGFFFFWVGGGGDEVRTHVNSQVKKSPLPEAQRRMEPTRSPTYYRLSCSGPSDFQMDTLLTTMPGAWGTGWPGVSVLPVGEMAD